MGPSASKLLDELLAGRHKVRVPLTEERRWLHEAQAVHPVGCRCRELECHGSGVRAAQHVCALDVEGVEELVAVTGVALDGSRSVHRAAAAVAAAVVKHDPVVIAQVGVVRQGDELVGEQRCLDQHERLSGAPDLDVEDGVRDRDEVTCSVGYPIAMRPIVILTRCVVRHGRRSTRLPLAPETPGRKLPGVSVGGGGGI